MNWQITINGKSLKFFYASSLLNIFTYTRTKTENILCMPYPNLKVRDKVIDDNRKSTLTVGSIQLHLRSASQAP